MKEFEKYLKKLADHEDKKNKFFLDTRKRILVNSGIQLNWIGDFIANPAIEFQKVEIQLSKIRFTGTEPDWNEILLKQCDASVENFQNLISTDNSIKKKFTKEASFSKKPILMTGPDNEGYYKTFDGMHRLVGAAIKKRDTITAYVPLNVDIYLPICEPHVVYDLIRGYQRHARDENGKIELYYALKLLARTYENVIDLLQNRFNQERLEEEDIQKIIQTIIAEHKK